MESPDRRPVRGYVVGMAIAPDGIKGNNHLRLEAPDNPDDTFRYLIQGRVDKGLSMAVIRGPGHARITVAQVDDVSQTEYRRGTFQLMPAPFARRHIFLQHAGRHDAGFAARGTGIIYLYPEGGIFSQSASQAERLIIGMGAYKEQRPLHFHIYHGLFFSIPGYYQGL
jgi:hypothetical protein